MLLAVAQSRSLHVVQEAYPCKSCFRNATYTAFTDRRYINRKRPIRKRGRQEDDDDEKPMILKGAMPSPNYGKVLIHVCIHLPMQYILAWSILHSISRQKDGIQEYFSHGTLRT